MSESSEEEREEEQSTVLPSPLRRSVSVGGQENEGRTSVLRALWAQQHQEEHKEAEERFTAEHGNDDDEDDEEDEDDEDGSDEDEGADQGDRVKTEPSFEREADAARYRRKLEERYVAEAARAQWMSSGGQSYGGYGGAYYPPPAEYATPAKAAAASETPAILKPMVDQVKALAQEVQEWRNKSAEPKNGEETKESPVVGVCDEVKESPVGRADEPESVNVLSESVACPAASEFVEETTDDEKEESIARVEKVITVNETVAEELRESVVASVPEPVGESELRIVPDEGDKVEFSGETVKDGAIEDERGGTLRPFLIPREPTRSVIVERFGLPPEGVKKIKKSVLPEDEMNAKDPEAVLYSNIGVPASDGTVEDSAVRDREDGEEPTVVTSPLVIRELGRRAVYEWLKKVREEDDRPESEGTPLEPSHREQVPEVDWVQLLTVTAEMTKRDSVPLPLWVTFSEWVERYHSKCGELVWKKLLEHEADKTSPKEEKEPKIKEPVDFDGSCFYVEVAEAVHG
ncbi:hypothetical protein PF008_g21934 [Phytophthora fragariae]|uniref:Uncharacterized protein n=1 Tax=Phytophthora fragariae TaxID=53985 RepID=A0A6G0QVA9_9STRA|nr:hypothetical protein PF008_g21934 [Phytophthora fragariae]